jgi:transcriptional regulator with XRE-family HTH domain
MLEPKPLPPSSSADSEHMIAPIGAVRSRCLIIILSPTNPRTKVKEKWQQNMSSGEVIQELREQRLVKTSEVERTSREIASVKGNADFYVSHSTLADVENGSVPSIYKLFSLAVCLKVSLEELLMLFGIDAKEATSFGANYETELPKATADEGCERVFPFLSGFEASFYNDETTLLTLNPREFATLPPTQPGLLASRRYRYAVIGLKDDTMGELIPPGSVVEIDTAETTVHVADWKTLRERPIYLVWHTDGHSCCWCHLEGKDLTVLPYPISQQTVRRFKVPREACVIGRVTKAWLPFHQWSSEDDRGRPMMPKRALSG